MKHVKIVIERHQDGYVAYPVGVKGIVVGAGDSFDEALRDVQSALRFHLETFGPDSLDADDPVIDAYIAQAAVA